MNLNAPLHIWIFSLKKPNMYAGRTDHLIGLSNSSDDRPYVSKISQIIVNRNSKILRETLYKKNPLVYVNVCQWLTDHYSIIIVISNLLTNVTKK